MKENIVNSFYSIGSLVNKVSFKKIIKSGAGILMYHRVLPKQQMENNYSGIIVSEEMFERQIKWLKEYREIISLDDLMTIKNKNEFKNKVALTFDDGYKDNLIHALPILKKYEAPATVYITNRFINGNAHMWWEELNSILNQKNEIKFTFKGLDFQMSLNNSKEIDQCYKKLRALFVSLSYQDQNSLLHVIRGDLQPINFINEVLNKKELNELANSNLISIGAHTVNHVVLKKQDKEVVFREINDSISELESILDKRVNHFAYPFGTLNEISSREVDVCREIGIKAATTTIYGLYDGTNDPLMIPRIAVKNRTTEKHLEVKLSGFNKLFFGIQI